ncbi:MAG: hypothetical protein Q7J84_14175 [Sulfuricaulis sp.]|nr:hypothetical protein [Sulfuricaulis sp.]
MRPRWANINELDRAAFRATIAFLNGRLEERATVDWALRLKPNDTSKRLALLELIDSPDGRKIGEPWRSAWRLIEESWNYPAVEHHSSISAYDAQRRLREGDRSGSLVNTIIELVAPRLRVESFSNLHLGLSELPRRPKKFQDLFATGLTSGEIIDPNVLGLGDLSDRSFLVSLALALDSAVVDGLDINRRISCGGERRMWELGQLHRVYYMPPAERAEGEHEPDEFHRGIAPSVKLLHAVVSRLADIDIPSAIEFVVRWKLRESSVHLRLWATLSRDPRVMPANEVYALLLSLDDQHFWNLHDYPEIAELRAKRFSEFDPIQQKAITARIRNRPPRSLWPRKTDASRLAKGQLYWALRELRRIEIAGASLSKHDKAWLDAGIHEFPDLVQMVRFDEGFMGTQKARFIPPNPDSRFDLLTGEERLKALETALSSARGGWDDDPAERAADWIRQQGNPVQLLTDLESIPDGGPAFARVWERFGWAHVPEAGQVGDAAGLNLRKESARVLSLLAKLPEATVRQAIDGISRWLSAWEKQIVTLPNVLAVWLKLWPIAVEVTNAKQPVEEEIHLNTVAHSSGDHEPMDLDTLNTPTGKLVGVFLAACPDLQENEHPFAVDSTPRTMRDTIIAADGRSGLIARHRMIEALHYFLRADPDWTHVHLFTPLIADNSDAIALWRAIARRTHFYNVLKIIGGPMAERATDRRLGRETRRSLVFSLVIECLHAFREQREPAVPYARIQQMIRSLDDEVRAYAAEAVQRFVHDLSAHREGVQVLPSPEELFRSAARPFLQQVWPQERSLATPGVSQVLADLPATAREAFAEAVNTIERFLVPFECWSLVDYGLYGEEDGRPKLSIIDKHEKAAALLRLLDLTIGTAEGSVIPHDLADALDQIRKVSPNLASGQEFRRLATTARRI